MFIYNYYMFNILLNNYYISNIFNIILLINIFNYILIIFYIINEKISTKLKYLILKCVLLIFNFFYIKSDSISQKYFTEKTRSTFFHFRQLYIYKKQATCHIFEACIFEHVSIEANKQKKLNNQNFKILM